MKNLSISLLALLLLLSVAVQAQTSTERKSMSEGVYTAVVMEVPGLNTKQAGDLWADFMKDVYDTRTKYNRRSKEFFADDAEIRGISLSNTVDIYTTFEESGDGVKLYIWYDLGGAYLSADQHPDRYIEAEKMLLRFGLEASKERVRMEIAEQEKALDDLMGDLKKLENQKEQLERDIERAQAAIAKAEEGLKENAGEQTDKQSEIEAQEALIEATKRKLRDL